MQMCYHGTVDGKADGYGLVCLLSFPYVLGKVCFITLLVRPLPINDEITTVDHLA